MRLAVGHDGHGFFQALGDSVITGPKRTSLNDFRAVVVEAAPEGRGAGGRAG
jgi:hydroxypyruvate reductase